MQRCESDTAVVPEAKFCQTLLLDSASKPCSHGLSLQLGLLLFQDHERRHTDFAAVMSISRTPQTTPGSHGCLHKLLTLPALSAALLGS